MIRAARPGDAGAIAALTDQLGYPTTTEETASRLAALGAREDHAIYVAEHAGAVIAWLAVRTDLSLDGGGYAEIAGLVVDERFRGRGIGARLARAAEAWALDRGHVRLRVRSNVVRERAHRFYERLGYSVTKRQVVFDKAILAPTALPKEQHPGPDA